MEKCECGNDADFELKLERWQGLVCREQTRSVHTAPICGACYDQSWPNKKTDNVGKTPDQALEEAYKNTSIKSQWQPIETAPKDGRAVLGVNGEDFFICACEAELELMVDQSSGLYVYPTHWMPLPEGPNA